jgi:hypothetical protein
MTTCVPTSPPRVHGIPNAVALLHSAYASGRTRCIAWRRHNCMRSPGSSLSVRLTGPTWPCLVPLYRRLKPSVMPRLR